MLDGVGQRNVSSEREDAEQDRELEHREQDIQASVKYVYAISKLNAGRHRISFAGNGELASGAIQLVAQI